MKYLLLSDIHVDTHFERWNICGRHTTYRTLKDSFSLETSPTTS